MTDPKHVDFKPKWMRNRTESDAILDECPTTGLPGDVVTIRGREIRVSPDDRQPGAEARQGIGLRVLRSIFNAALEMRERDKSRP